MFVFLEYRKGVLNLRYADDKRKSEGKPRLVDSYRLNVNELN